VGGVFAAVAADVEGGGGDREPLEIALGCKEEEEEEPRQYVRRQPDGGRIESTRRRQDNSPLWAM